MAYLLRFDDAISPVSGDYVTFSSGIGIFSGDDFSILIDATPAANVDHYRPLGGTSIGDSSPRVICFAGGTVRLSGQSNRNWTGPSDLALINTLEFRRVGGRLDLFVNGVQAAGGFDGDTNSYDGIGGAVGGNWGSTSRAFDLRGIAFEVNGVTVRNLDPSASNGTGSTLIDTVGGNNGTLENFPTDDSQWVYYDDGSSTTPTLTAKITGITATSAVPVTDVEF